MTDARPTDLRPAEARALLDQAAVTARRAHDGVRWPYVTFIVALGAATSTGTLAMGLTEGRAFAGVYVGTIAVVLALVTWFTISIRGRSAFARGRRWSAYIAAWAVTYCAAIAVVAWVHGSLLWSGVTSGAVLVVALACAAWESRS